MKALQSLKNFKPLGGWKVVIMTAAVSFAFYEMDREKLNGGTQHLTYLGYALLYGFAVYGTVWAMFLTKNALVRTLERRRGRPLNLHWKAYATISYFGMIAGMFLAEWTIANLQGYAFHADQVWDSLFVANFIFLMFLFFMAFTREKDKNAKLQVAQAEAELHVFKNQMQPHFLFNALNSLTELMESNQAHASAMTQNLADLYREILDTSKKQMSPVSDELSIVRKYLELEQLRFGGRLRYSIALENSQAARPIFLPSLILQTLVENAVKHGISQSLDGGEIEVRISSAPSGGYLAEIKNSHDGAVSPATPAAGLGLGLANTRSRLDLHYGDRHRFELNVMNDATRASFWFSGDVHAAV